jgi:hypothetical protein
MTRKGSEVRVLYGPPALSWEFTPVGGAQSLPRDAFPIASYGNAQVGNGTLTQTPRKGVVPVVPLGTHTLVEADLAGPALPLIARLAVVARLASQRNG